MQMLEQVDIVSIDATIWTGRKKLRAEDINLGDGGALPPDEVASLGSKKVINPDDLNPFYRLKRQAERLCEAAGVRFLGGYAIPREKTPVISAELEKIRKNYLVEKGTFLTNYDTAVNNWVAQHPEFETALRRAITPRSEVDSRIGFHFSIFRISAADEHAGALPQQVASMGNKLLDEVAADADEMFERQIAGKNELSIRCRSTIERMRNKLDGLSFLDGAISPMVKAIDDVLAKFPDRGPIVAPLLSEVTSLVLILSDPDKVRLHAQGLLSVSAMGWFADAAEHALAEADSEDEGDEDLQYEMVLEAPMSAAQAPDEVVQPDYPALAPEIERPAESMLDDAQAHEAGKLPEEPVVAAELPEVIAQPTPETAEPETVTAVEEVDTIDADEGEEDAHGLNEEIHVGIRAVAMPTPPLNQSFFF